jgi:hypothetical protein
VDYLHINYGRKAQKNKARPDDIKGSMLNIRYFLELFILLSFLAKTATRTAAARSPAGKALNIAAPRVTCCNSLDRPKRRYDKNWPTNIPCPGPHLACGPNAKQERWHMIDQKASINWNESYQNPGKDRQELGCNTAADAISAADRALYLELLLRGNGQANAFHRPRRVARGRGS